MDLGPGSKETPSYGLLGLRQEKPYFVGAFYRYLLNRIEELDKVAFINELDERFLSNAIK